MYDVRHRQLIFDLDGTLASWAYPDIGPPTVGARDTLLAFQSRGYTIGVATGRMDPTIYTAEELRLAELKVQAWLMDHDIPFDFIYPGKPVALGYIDDRGVHFDATRPNPWGAVVRAVERLEDVEAARA
jgi:hypothetical protein